MKRKHKALLGVVTVFTVFAIWLVVNALHDPRFDNPPLHDETPAFEVEKQKNKG